jgi:hypothetical protein
VSGAVLGLGSDVEDYDLPLLDALFQFGRRKQFDGVPLTQVFARKHRHLGDVARGDVTNRCPQLRHPLASEPVEDTIPIAPRPRQAGPGEQAQMVRGGGHALSDLRCDLLDRAFALREQIDDLGAPPAAKCRANRSERVEQRALGLTAIHIFKLILE